MNNFSTRLKQGLEARNMKATDLSKLTGIGKSSISDWLSGRYEAKQDKVYIIAKVLNVDEAWLMGLDVPMEKPRDILSTYNQLDSSRQLKVIDFAEKQLEEQNKIVEFKRSDIVIDNTLAAHLVDPTKEFTDDQIDGLKAYLDKARDEYFKKHEK